MLFARGSLSVGSASYRSHVAIDRRVRVYTVERCGVVYDTRVAPCRARPAAPIGVVWLVLSGGIEWHDGMTASSEAPVAYAMSEAIFEGACGRRAATLRAHGAPFLGIEIRTRRVIEDAPRRLCLSPRVWAA